MRRSRVCSTIARRKSILTEQVHAGQISEEVGKGTVGLGQPQLTGSFHDRSTPVAMPYAIVGAWPSE